MRNKLWDRLHASTSRARNMRQAVYKHTHVHERGVYVAENSQTPEQLLVVPINKECQTPSTSKNSKRFRYRSKEWEREAGRHQHTGSCETARAPWTDTARRQRRQMTDPLHHEGRSYITADVFDPVSSCGGRRGA
ncbi:hypothetical protein J6590_010564 [Homalodisca vitripennis]|nr:hypothetical protein J6590_010564 [Homalodisca vitripennis]